METGALKLLDAALYRRGVLIAALARWVSLSLALVSLALAWDAPGTSRGPAVAVAVAYVAVQVFTGAGLGRYPTGRPLTLFLDAADAVALGLGAAFTGGFASPIWLLLYPHVVAVSVRRGLAFALGFGALDAAVLALLSWTSGESLGALHALALVFCAFMGGITSSYLHAVRNRLAEVNAELESANRRLSGTVGAQLAARHEQEVALARLQASEERYRLLLERIQDGVVIIHHGRVVSVNEAFAAMVGRPAQALSGIDFVELVPDEDREEMRRRRARWEQARSESGALECRLLRPGGTLLVSVRVGSVEFEDRRSVVATVRDITRERAMERDLSIHAERLAALNELANELDLNLTVEDILGAVAQGVPRLVAFDELTIALCGDGGEVDLLRPAAGALERARLPVPRDEILWALGGGFAWCRVARSSAPAHAERLLGPGIASLATVPLTFKARVIGSLNLGRREAVGFSGLELAALEPLARHVAAALENARLIEAVRRRSEQLESLLEVGRSISERLDLKEVLPLVTRSVNRVMGTRHCILLLRAGDRLAVAAQEGFEPEVLAIVGNLRLGESLSGWVAREGRPLALEDFRADPRARFLDAADRFGYRSLLCVPLKRGAEVAGTLEVVTRDRRRFSEEDLALMTAFAAQAAVAIDNARLFEEARARLGEAEEANRRLEELHVLRQQYLRNVSHEFRTPLTVIKGYAEFLQDNPAAHDGLAEVLHIMVESCDRLIDMVDTLIDVNRLEQEGAEATLQLQSVDLLELAEGSVEGVRPAASRKGVALAVDFAAGALRMQGDAGLLHQLLRKLLDNAVKYSPKGGRVVVRGREEGEVLAVEVEDEGIGIAEEHLPRIFEKFYTVDGGLTRLVGGTGVGLYLVREIVRLHQGSVTVRSLPGQGSVFSVRLPRSLRAPWHRAASA